MHEYARPGGARKSRLEPPRRQGREGFLTFSSFLCGLCAFAVQISETAKAGRPRSGREYTNARIRPARWRKKIAVGTAETPRARRFSYFFSSPLRPLRLCGSNLRNRQSGPSTKRTRIREHARSVRGRPRQPCATALGGHAAIRQSLDAVVLPALWIGWCKRFQTPDRCP